MLPGNADAALLLFTAALASFIGAWITEQFGWDVYCALAVTVSTCALVVQCHRWSRRGAFLFRPPFRLVAIIALATLLEVFGLPTVDRLGGSGFRAAYAVIRYASVATLCFSWLVGAVVLSSRAPISVIAADMVAAVAVLVAVHAYQGRELDFYEAGIVNVTGYAAAAFALYNTLKAVTNVASLVSAATWSVVAAACIAHHSGCDFLLPYGVVAYALVVTAACLWWGLHGIVSRAVRALVVLTEMAPIMALLFIGHAHPEIILTVFPKPFSLLGLMVIEFAVDFVRRSYFNNDFNRRAERWQASVGIAFGGWFLAAALLHLCLTASWDAAEALYLDMLDNSFSIGKLHAVMVLLSVCSGLTAELRHDRVGVGLTKRYSAVAVLAFIAVAVYSRREPRNIMTAVAAAELWVLGLFEVHLCVTLGARHRSPVVVFFASLAIATVSATAVWLLHAYLGGAWVDVLTLCFAADALATSWLYVLQGRYRHHLATNALPAC